MIYSLLSQNETQPKETSVEAAEEARSEELKAMSSSVPVLRSTEQVEPVDDNMDSKSLGDPVSGTITVSELKESLESEGQGGER